MVGQLHGNDSTVVTTEVKSVLRAGEGAGGSYWYQ